MAIGKKAGDMKTLKRDLKSSGGEDKWFWRVAADDEIRVRFLAEPYDATKFFQHFDNTRPKGKQGYPCTDDGNCVGCEEGLDKRVSWVIPALDIEGDRVRALQIPKTIMDLLYARADRYDTIMDRDFLVMREGTTKDNTKYMLDALDRKRRDLKQYAEHMPDIEAMLEEQLQDAMDDDDDDWGKPKKGVKKKGVAKKTPRAAASRRAADDDEEDDDESPRRGVKRSTGAARTGVRKSAAPPPVAKTGLKKKSSGGLRRR